MKRICTCLCLLTFTFSLGCQNQTPPPSSIRVPEGYYTESVGTVSESKTIKEGLLFGVAVKIDRGTLLAVSMKPHGIGEKVTVATGEVIGEAALPERFSVILPNP